MMMMKKNKKKTKTKKMMMKRLKALRRLADVQRFVRRLDTSLFRSSALLSKGGEHSRDPRGSQARVERVRGGARSLL